MTGSYAELYLEHSEYPVRDGVLIWPRSARADERILRDIPGACVNVLD
jgi:hypothetical protein